MSDTNSGVRLLFRRPAWAQSIVYRRCVESLPLYVHSQQTIMLLPRFTRPCTSCSIVVKVMPTHPYLLDWYSESDRCLWNSNLWLRGQDLPMQRKWPCCKSFQRWRSNTGPAGIHGGLWSLLTSTSADTCSVRALDIYATLLQVPAQMQKLRYVLS